MSELPALVIPFKVFGPGKFEIRKFILTRHHAGPEPDA